MANKIIQVKDSIPWVRCASGNVWEVYPSYASSKLCEFISTFFNLFSICFNFSHFSQLFTNLFLVRLFSGVSLCDGVNCLMKHTQIHSHYICKVFLRCAFYCGFSMWLPERLRNHSGHICLVFLQCVFFCGLSMYLFVQKIIHIGHTC